ncbi:MAG: MaoC family dehydratase [Dehalococcoidia bacterium]|tara:strand:- start:6181 stop:6594 length:414 start_codon:yes stop_codon:yes gene_type:complete
MKNLQVGDDLLPIKKLITMKQILMYADASGDYNPIHIDEEFAKNSQFGRNIGHGMMVAATISELMVKNFAEAWYKTGKMKMRFKSPVYPEDEIQTSGSIKKSEQVGTATRITCSVQIVRQNGDTIISGETLVTLKSP